MNRTNCMRLVFISIVPALLIGCASNKVLIGQENAGLLPKHAANEYAVYAMMAANTYLHPKRTYFDLSKLGWKKVDLEGNVTSGNSYTPTWFGNIFSSLQYDIWEKGEDRAVIAFKGTDEKVDWFTNFWIGPTVAYKSAKKHVKKYKESNPNRTSIVVTGHSLGGGLALSSSLWEGVDAYAFNSSPRVFDGWKDNKKPAIRIAIFQDKEILSKLRSLWPKFKDVISEEDTYQTNFDYDGVNLHRIDYLAEGLLRCSEDDLELVSFAQTVTPVRVICSLKD